MSHLAKSAKLYAMLFVKNNSLQAGRVSMPGGLAINPTMSYRPLSFNIIPRVGGICLNMTDLAYIAIKYD